MLRCSVMLRGTRSASPYYEVYSVLPKKSVVQSKVPVRTTTYVSVVQSKYYSVCYKELFPYNKRGALVWVQGARHTKAKPHNHIP